MKFRHTDFDDSVNVTAEHPLLTFAKYGAAMVGLLMAIYIALGFLADVSARRVSVETELWISSKLAPTFPETAKAQDEPSAEQEYIESLFAAIPKHDLPPLPYQIRVADNDRPNAMALPGGTIIVHSGLLKAIPSENGLTFVLGHELGHYANRDHLRGLGRGLVLTLTSIMLLGENKTTAHLAQTLLNVTNLSYSRGQESAADEWGLKLLMARYGHVGGANDLFRVLKKQDDLLRWVEFVSTHPVSEKRIDAVNIMIKQLNYPLGETLSQPFYYAEN